MRASKSLELSALFVFIWQNARAELKGGGAKRTEKQNLAKMARRKPFFETLRKRSENVSWGKFWEFLRGLLREMAWGGGQNVERWGGVGNRFPWGVSSWGFAPPPLFCSPVWRSLECLLPRNYCDNDFLSSVQTRCVVKGEAQKSPLLWRFSGGFWFCQDRLFSRNSARKPSNLIESPIFTNAPCFYSLHQVCALLISLRIIFVIFEVFCTLKISRKDREEESMDAGVDQNYQRDLGAISAYEFSSILVPCSRKTNLYGQWPWNFINEFPWDWHWSMDGSSPKKLSHGVTIAAEILT